MLASLTLILELSSVGEAEEFLQALVFGASLIATLKDAGRFRTGSCFALVLKLISVLLV